MSLDYSLELQVAVAAVQRACTLTSSVFNKLVKDEKLTKGDKSPVTGECMLYRSWRQPQSSSTVGDFAAQAVVNTILGNAFPSDPIVGEEDSAELRGDEPATVALRQRVIELANQALTADLVLGDNEQWGIGPGKERTEEQLLEAIDRGNYDGGKQGSTLSHWIGWNERLNK